ncbi:hypothetical protein ACFQI7_36030 [Paenibacillus allorhizosphaerae]|uniref:ATP-binding protein n=1 Tax=Paenibacillus allorhizosphaerae TaxID=2849866 RepID=A0ABN7U207_9BACL|nr:ATP-binding protein [Paenibacillus allorhizosphaerae]CAG7659032.1 hypothetical protein PAECIP111802_07285 [Paenibacillus allorhizosphaerae]
MKLSEKLIRTEQNRFVGRGPELELMHRHAAGKWEWQWLHIHGQGGIGKSTLLSRFKSEWTHSRSLLLDGGRGIHRKEDVLEMLSEQLQEPGDAGLDINAGHDHILRRVNQLSEQSDRGLILLIDVFEKWRPVEDWFSQWVQELESSVRIVSAGRHPLTGAWLRNGWASLIFSMPLPTLTPADVEGYALKRGISDRESQSRLVRFSGCVPLAMTLAAEVILRGDGCETFEHKEQIRLITVLMDELLHGLPPAVRRLFEAATVMWRFNEERLISVLDGEFDVETFREFVSLPFVIANSDGWMLHDAVRAWAQDDLLRRKPHFYEQMRRKALKHIHSEEKSNAQMRNKLGMDKLYLHEHPLVRNTCFSGQLDDLELRECMECDLPAIQSLYIRYMNVVAPSSRNEHHLEGMLRPIWHADPSSYVTVWQQNRLIAFYGMIPLHERTLSVLADEPLLKPFIRGFRPVPKAYLSCFTAIEPELEGSARAFIVNSLMNHYRAAEWLLTFTCYKEWFSVFELCGFVRAAWADAATVFGTEYRAFALDLAHEDFLAILDRMLTHRIEEQETEAETETAQPPDVHLLKQVLRAWSRLPRESTFADAYTRLYPHRTMTGESQDNSGRSIQQDVLGMIARLAEGDHREQLWAKLLTYAYIQEIRPHERVAERLGLSSATYYRHLNKALERLHQLLSG